MSQSVRTIVVGVAAPDALDPALVPALALARRLGASLHVVHVVGPGASAHPSSALPAPRPADGADHPGSEHWRSLVATVRARAGGARFTCHVVEGSPAERLCEVARGVSADLLVIGVTRRSRVWRQFLGTTAEAVVRRAALPVLVVRHAAALEPRHVLLAADLSVPGEELHERGLDLVGALFRGSDPELRALLAVPDTALPPVLSRGSLERIAQRELDRFIRERRPRGRAVQGRVRIGSPADEILADAAEWRADLIVLGTRRRSGAEIPPLDRTDHAVLRRAGVSVLVVPDSGSITGAPGERAGLLPALVLPGMECDPLHLPVAR